MMFPAGNGFHNRRRNLGPIAHTCRIRREKRAPTLGITCGEVLVAAPSTTAILKV